MELKSRCTYGHYRYRCRALLVPWDEWRVVGLAAARSRRGAVASCNVEILSSHNFGLITEATFRHMYFDEIAANQVSGDHNIGVLLHLTETE